MLNRLCVLIGALWITSCAACVEKKKKLYMIGGGPVACKSEERPCGLTLYECGDNNKFFIRCATDVAEIEQ